MRVSTSTLASLAALGVAAIAGVHVAGALRRRGHGLRVSARDDGDAGRRSFRSSRRRCRSISNIRAGSS